MNEKKKCRKDHDCMTLSTPCPTCAYRWATPQEKKCEHEEVDCITCKTSPDLMNGLSESPAPDKDCDCGVFSEGKLCMGDGCDCPKSLTPDCEEFLSQPHFGLDADHIDDIVDFIRTTVDEAYRRGRQSVIDEWNHEQKKMLDGFGHPKGCGQCKQEKLKQ